MRLVKGWGGEEEVVVVVAVVVVVVADEEEVVQQEAKMSFPRLVSRHTRSIPPEN